MTTKMSDADKKLDALGRVFVEAVNEGMSDTDNHIVKADKLITLTREQVDEISDELNDLIYLVSLVPIDEWADIVSRDKRIQRTQGCLSWLQPSAPSGETEPDRL